MPFTIQDLLLGILVPAAASFGLAAGASGLTRPRPLPRPVAPLAVVCGFLLGYWLLELGPLRPKLDRDWVPYSAVFALIPAALPGRSRVARLVRLAVLAIVIFASAWLLVPTWPTLDPSRTVYLWSWSTYTLALAGGLLWIARTDERLYESVPSGGTSTATVSRSAAGDTPTEKHASSHTARDAQPTTANLRGQSLWLVMMIGALAAASALLALSGSLRFAQTTAAAMAAYAGLAAALVAVRPASTLGGVALVYSLLSSAAMLTGQVNSFSEIPTFSYVLLPLAPFAYGLAVLRQPMRPLPMRRLLLVLAIAVGIAVLALALALAAEFAGEETDEVRLRPITLPERPITVTIEDAGCVGSRLLQRDTHASPIPRGAEHARLDSSRMTIACEYNVFDVL